VLICAAFLFRVSNASVFGSLNTIGQLAIKSDERRALLFSLSSSVSSFLMAIVFFAFFVVTYKVAPGVGNLSREIESFWRLVPLTWIALLALGGYLATRPHLAAK
jgi:ABC-type dipeptide/oligopeptide/nickel transport system permease component